MNFNFNEIANKLNGSTKTPLPTTVNDNNSSFFSFMSTKENVDTTEESQGLMSAGVSAFNSLSSQTRNIITGTRDRVNELTLTREKIMIAVVAIITGIIFFFLSFTVLPLMLISPHKFAILFTLGSLCFLFAFSTLKGHKEFLTHLLSKERLSFTLSYVSTLVLTIYFSMFMKSYILTLVFSVLQIIALLYFTISYIPGGVRMLNFIGKGISDGGKRLIRGEGSAQDDAGILNIV